MLSNRLHAITHHNLIRLPLHVNSLAIGLFLPNKPIWSNTRKTKQTKICQRDVSLADRYLSYWTPFVAFAIVPSPDLRLSILASLHLARPQSIYPPIHLSRRHRRRPWSDVAKLWRVCQPSHKLMKLSSFTASWRSDDQTYILRTHRLSSATTNVDPHARWSTGSNNSARAAHAQIWFTGHRRRRERV